MVKDKKKLGLVARKIGSAFSDIAIASAHHPVTAGLFIMGGTTLISTLADMADKERKSLRSQRLRDQMEGLYGGAQTVAAASAVAPVVVGAISMIREAIVTRRAKEKKT